MNGHLQIATDGTKLIADASIGLVVQSELKMFSLSFHCDRVIVSYERSLITKQQWTPAYHIRFPNLHFCRDKRAHHY